MFANIPLITSLGESEQLSWDMAKEIIQAQSTLAIYGITAVVGLAVVVVAASWIWNFFLHKRELERAIVSLKSVLTAEGKRDFMELTKRVNDKIEKIKKEIEKSVEERLTEFNAEKARLFAFANMQLKTWEQAANWWAIAIKGYAKTGMEDGLRLAVDQLVMSLGKCEKLNDKYKKSVSKCLSSIPRILQEEKEQIEKKLKELPEETKKH